MSYVAESTEDVIQLMIGVGVVYDDKFFSEGHFGQHVKKNDYFEAGGWMLYNQGGNTLPVEEGTAVEVVFEDGSGGTCNVEDFYWLAPVGRHFMKYRKPQQEGLPLHTHTSGVEGGITQAPNKTTKTRNFEYVFADGTPVTSFINTKIKVDCPEQSVKVQEDAFSYGMAWLSCSSWVGGRSRTPEYTEKPQLYFDDDYTIGHSDNVEFFDTCDSMEEIFIKPCVSVPKESGNKYTRTMKGVEFDAYDVIEACGIKCPALQHAAKKVLYTGVRGHKDEEQDLQDIIDSAHRAMELYKNRIKYNKENK